MNKLDIAYAVRSALAETGTRVTVRRAEEMAEAVLWELRRGIAEEPRVEIRGFGRWKKRTKKMRTGRNPKTGKLAVIRARTVAVFKPGVPFVSQLNAE